jgi:acyl-coenzyme A synthetase/AMP-(fatty) acid ligase
MYAAYPFGREEVCCAKTALTFVDSVWELFGPLIAGVPLVMLPHATVGNPGLLLSVLARQKVTRLVVVPVFLAVILDAMQLGEVDLKALEVVVVSGDVLEVSLVQRFRRVLPRCKLLNLYGSTEVAADVTFYDVSFGCIDWPSGRVPIGRPIANTQAYILDEHLKPVPIGHIGEICASGHGTALGYWGEPELTNAKFVPDPYHIGPIVSRLFRTGDRGRFLQDGCIEYMGRMDRQVKVNGQRVELGEIESVLIQHDSVQLCAVVLIKPSGFLAAFVTLTESASATSAGALRTQLVAHAKQLLPQYMIPSVYRVLSEMPTNTSGKLDRRALPDMLGTLQATDGPEEDAMAMQATGGSGRPGAGGPRRAVEAALAALWRELPGTLQSFRHRLEYPIRDHRYNIHDATSE